MSALPQHAAPASQITQTGLSAARRAGRALRVSPRGLCDMSAWSRIVLLCQNMIGKRLIFFPPEDAEQSFDERWLLAVIDAVRRADADSYRFLLLSRMSAERASALHFPLCRLVHRLDNSTG